MSSRRAYDGHWGASIAARRKSNSVAPAFVVCASTPASATTNVSVSLCRPLTCGLPSSCVRIGVDGRSQFEICTWPVAITSDVNDFV